MFTSSQQLADARANSLIFTALALSGAVFGVCGWWFFLPDGINTIPFGRFIRALIFSSQHRAFFQQYNVITLFFVWTVGGAIGLPLLIAAIKKSRNSK